MQILLFSPLTTGSQMKESQNKSDMEQTAPKKTSDELAQERTDMASERTDLAIERTILANDRTLMAWIRTAVSLISFGFTIYKFMQEFRKDEHAPRPDTFFTPRIVGMMLIGIGFLGLSFALIQYRSDMKRLRALSDLMSRSLTPVFAMLILVLGLMLFFAALFRQ